MPKLRHFDNCTMARFITFSCYRRHRYLIDLPTRKAVIDQLSVLRNRHEVKILGYVIMPEHMHLVLWPPEDMSLGLVIGQLKGRISKDILSHKRKSANTHHGILVRSDGRAAVWQRRCYDHNCRLPEVVIEKINYCHNNPVTRGLVATPDDWPWSSSRWYSGGGDVILEIDGYEI